MLSHFKKLIFALLVAFVGCSQKQAINLQTHEFRSFPLQIVFLNLEGLEFEHLGLLKLSSKDVRSKLAFEEMLCIGETWNSSLTTLRSPPRQSFFQMMTSVKSDVDNCLDDERKPIWEFQEFRGHRAGLYEVGVLPQDSFHALTFCKSGKRVTENVTFLSGREEKKENGFEPFHFQTTKTLALHARLFDQSCRKTGDCYARPSDNFLRFIELINENRKRSINVYQDQRYFTALEKKDMSTAREVLVEWEFMLSELMNMAKKNSKMLIVIASGGGFHLHLPNQGKSWEEFEKKGINISRLNPKVTGQVFSFGARAENFCGVYHNSDIFYRFFWTPLFNNRVDKD
jgi:hypothetical protein